MDDDLELTTELDKSNSIIVEEKLLLLKIFVLSLQDLNLELFFKELRHYFIINKKPKKDIQNMHTAFTYFLKDESDYILSFANFCEVFKLKETAVRERILGLIRKQRSLVHNQLVIWETIHESGDE